MEKLEEQRVAPIQILQEKKKTNQEQHVHLLFTWNSNQLRYARSSSVIGNSFFLLIFRSFLCS